jgi:ParB family chromosome partitioning protein
MIATKVKFPGFDKKEAETKPDNKKITMIPIDLIRPNPYQPRRKFDQASLDELCQSIKQYGVIQPINVRKISPTHYELVAGERRLRASALAGLKEIPTIVVDCGEDDSAILALIENLQREDLGYMEEAEAIAISLRSTVSLRRSLPKKSVKASLPLPTRFGFYACLPWLRSCLPTTASPNAMQEPC